MLGNTNIETQKRREKCSRDLARLQRLEMRHRFRAIALRGFRGFVGFILGLASAFKLKIAATLSGKIMIALLIGLGFAWPAAAATVIVVALIILSIAVLCDGCGHMDCTGVDCSCDCCNSDCKRRNTRRERLLIMIEQRKNWLAKDEGPPPNRHSLEKAWMVGRRG